VLLLTVYPRYVPHDEGNGKWDNHDVNAVTDHVLAGETVSGFLAYPYSYIVRSLGAGLYDAINAIGTRVYGGADDEGLIDGADLGAVVQAATNAGSTVIFGDGTFTFTVAKYFIGDEITQTFPIGCRLKDDIHIVISKGATVTQADGLQLRVLFGGNLGGTYNGVALSGVVFEVYGMIDGNYGAQSYTQPSTEFEACPIALYAAKSSFPIIRAKEFGRYGALVIYGAYNNVGEIYTETSYDVTHHQANAVNLERCEETIVSQIIGTNLDGRGVQISDGGHNIIIKAINTYGCFGNLLLTSASALAVKAISIGQIVSAGHYGDIVGGYGILIAMSEGLGQVSDITIDSAIISSASADGIKISLGTPATARVKRVTIGQAILFNNGQHAGTNCALILGYCDDVKIGSLIAYDDQTPKTQYWGITFGASVTNFLLKGGNITGNTDTVNGYTTAKGVMEHVVGFLTINHGESTGTGAQQTIPHGLGATPTWVRFWDYSGTDEADVDLLAASDAVNIYPRATNGKNYLWEAYI
jgi:hypothetical protein